jgi:hypothetical protein
MNRIIAWYILHIHSAGIKNGTLVLSSGDQHTRVIKCGVAIKHTQWSPLDMRR